MPEHMRIGHGWDLHRLEPPPPDGAGRPLRLGGVPIEHPTGPVSHSDGDALLHAVTDALLGAIGEADLGSRFPDTDPAWADADSSDLLKAAWATVTGAGWRLGNLDATVICQSPHIGPHRDAITANLAALLDCDPADVNIKGKTHEHVDAVGEGRAIEVHVIALLAQG